MSREAIKLALEALEKHAELGLFAGATITILKQALEQPEPEPREHPPCKGMNCGITRTDQQHSIECEAEHAAAIAGGRFVKPEQPEPEPVAWAISYDGETPYTLWDGGDCALLDIEVKRHGGKTRKMPLYASPPKRESEPVVDKSAAIRIATSLGWTPKREWQGLTDEEIDEGQRQSWVEKQAFESAVWWAEAKLKEKNT